MTVSYDIFTKAFLDKVTEYRFCTFSENNRQSLVDGYMKRACAKFGEVCKYDITNGDDETRTFTLDDITAGELDEIADIVSEGMLVQWMKPYVFMQKNLEMILVTSDHSVHSQAELVNRVTGLYTLCNKNYTNMVREYSYRHGDLTELHV